MIWSVPQTWQGETCAILAGGPSLRGFDPKPLFDARVKIITINDSWRIAPRGSVNYFCDGSWWTYQMARNPRALPPWQELSFHDQIYKGFWVTGGVGFHEHPQVHSLRLTGQLGLESDRGGMKHGSNSGYQAIHLAYHYGATRILLLGYDMKVEGNRTHWHDEQRQAPAGFAATIERAFLVTFPYLKEPLERAGVTVINCTPGSALKVWKYAPLEEALKQPVELAEKGA